MIDALFDAAEYAVSLTMAERFVAPPLSVIDTRQGYWQDRRDRWDRDCPALARTADRGREVTGAGALAKLDHSTGEVAALIAAIGGGASVFDPVLAELAYTWWTRAGDEIYDPFAGGPARGLVAGMMGRQYLGLDLRDEQVDHNEEHAIDGVRWRVGDAVSYHPYPCDFIFSCPPYGSLEQYSDSPQDLSTMSWQGFSDGYRRAIGRGVDALRQDRFAAFVVGNFKERGIMRDLHGLTLDAFERAGADYYADLVLVSPVGTAAVRAGFSFPRNRRPVPSHQYLLVFVKGDARAAADRLADDADRLAPIEFAP